MNKINETTIKQIENTPVSLEEIEALKEIKRNEEFRALNSRVQYDYYSLMMLCMWSAFSYGKIIGKRSERAKKKAKNKGVSYDKA